MAVNKVELTFAGSPLDPMDNRRGDENWIRQVLTDSATHILPVRRLDVVVQKDKRDVCLKWLQGINRHDYAVDVLHVFLGVKDGKAYFACDADSWSEKAVTAFQSEDELMDARSAAAGLDAPEAAILAKARSMIDWHQRHGFCARCGAPTRATRAGYQRICINTGCAAEHFPRVDPVVIMLILQGDKCLIGRQPRFPEGMYSALAGFIEPGETIEEAVRRESLEEVGIRVGRVSYIASQPWPFPSNLMIGCIAEAQTTKITLDGAELEDARWVSRQDIIKALARSSEVEFFVPPPVAIAHQLLRYWAEVGAGP